MARPTKRKSLNCLQPCKFWVGSGCKWFIPFLIFAGSKSDSLLCKRRSRIAPVVQRFIPSRHKKKRDIKKCLKNWKRGLTKAAAQSIIPIVLCGECVAPKNDSINKASELWRANRYGLVSVWDSRGTLYRESFSTATPKPRAGGSSPSAPAINIFLYNFVCIWYNSRAYKMAR